MTRTQQGVLFFSISMISMGSTAAISDRMLQYFPVFFGVCAIFFITLLVFLPFTHGFTSTLKSLTRKDWIFLLAQSLIGVVLFRIFFLYAIQYSGPVEMGILISLTPAVLVLLHYIFFGARVLRRDLYGIAFAVFGVIIMKLDLLLNPIGPVSLIGIVLALIAVVFDAIFILTGSRLSSHINPMHKTYIVSLLSFCCLLPLGIIEGINLDWRTITLTSWWPILAYGAIANPITYLCLYLGGNTISSALSGTLTSFIPLSAIFFSILISRSYPTPYHYGGAALIMISIFVIASAHTKKSAVK